MIRKLGFLSFALAVFAALAACAPAEAHAASFGLALSPSLGQLGSLGSIAGLIFLGRGMASIVPAGGGTENHAGKGKWFRIALEGATTDGRTIERVWLEQIAANFDPKKYGARINLEHFRGIYPDSPFKAYGDVIAVEAREEEDGKLGLYAQLEPTPELIAMTKAKQKIYTSCEIDPSFADTKQAYLVGLAVTDSPASLGTQVLEFAAKNPDASPFKARKQSPQNVFSEAMEAAFELEANEPAAPKLLARVADLLGLVKKNTDKGDARFADITQAVEALATHGKEQADTVATLAATNKALEKQVADLVAAAEKDREAFAALQTQLAKEGNGQPQRPAATGKSSTQALTDC